MGPIREIPEIRTPRLWLRAWRDTDHHPFARLNADARVMEHFPARLTPEESAAAVQHIGVHFAQHGFGLWAVEVPGAADFIGFIGLNVPSFSAYFTPCVEIGWRLAAEYWGYGYASEGARAALDFGFGRLGLDELVSFTVPANVRSRRVMERIGLQHAAADEFDHPNVPPGHALRRHVLYRITRAQWSRLPPAS